MAVLNYAKYWDSRSSDLVVVDTDWVFDGVSFLTSGDVEGMIAPHRHVRLHGWRSRFRFMDRSKLTSVIFLFVLKPIIYWARSRTAERSLFDELSRYDFVILTDNDCALSFPGRRKQGGAKLVGTSHCFSPTRLHLAILTLLPFSWIHRVDYLQVFRNPRTDLSLRTDQLLFLPSGVDTTVFRPRHREEGGPLRFLFVSRLVEEKGVIQLMHAWSKVAHRGDAELHIAGDGPLREMVKKGLPENVTYHGRLSTEALATLYSSCDVFVYPTKADTFALVVAQAFACGLYCIISDDLRGVWDEFVQMGCAEYVNPVDEDGIATRIDFLISNRDRILRGRQDSSHVIASKYAWKAIATKLQASLTIPRG